MSDHDHAEPPSEPALRVNALGSLSRRGNDFVQAALCQPNQNEAADKPIHRLRNPIQNVWLER